MNDARAFDGVTPPAEWRARRRQRKCVESQEGTDGFEGERPGIVFLDNPLRGFREQSLPAALSGRVLLKAPNRILQDRTMSRFSPAISRAPGGEWKNCAGRTPSGSNGRAAVSPSRRGACSPTATARPVPFIVTSRPRSLRCGRGAGRCLGGWHANRVEPRALDGPALRARLGVTIGELVHRFC
jgi:hypothetical protein